MFRSSLDTIADQEIGYSHPLGAMVDILFGGGRCSFFPQGHSRSCRGDDVDLWKYAEEQGFYVAQNLSSFDALDNGFTNIPLPFLGLFNDGMSQAPICCAWMVTYASRRYALRD